MWHNEKLTPGQISKPSISSDIKVKAIRHKKSECKINNKNKIIHKLHY